MNFPRQNDEWGRIIVDPASVFELLYNGFDASAVMVKDDPLIEEYNDWCSRFDKPQYEIEAAQEPTNTPEEEHAERSSTWFISDDIREIPVREFLLSLCERDDERDRVNLEMDMFEERKLIPLLQLMMFLVDHFQRHKIVWGVGRGSSVASYCLYLIGVHMVDSIKYGLSIEEFLK